MAIAQKANERRKRRNAAKGHCHQAISRKLLTYENVQRYHLLQHFRQCADSNCVYSQPAARLGLNLQPMQERLGRPVQRADPSIVPDDGAGDVAMQRDGLDGDGDAQQVFSASSMPIPSQTRVDGLQEDIAHSQQQHTRHQSL